MEGRLISGPSSASQNIEQAATNGHCDVLQVDERHQERRLERAIPRFKEKRREKRRQLFGIFWFKAASRRTQLRGMSVFKEKRHEERRVERATPVLKATRYEERAIPVLKAKRYEERRHERATPQFKAKRSVPGSASAEPMRKRPEKKEKKEEKEEDEEKLTARLGTCTGFCCVT